MNYDFSEKQFMLFVDLHERIKAFAGGKDLECRGADADHLRGMLSVLAETPYLKLLIESGGKDDGMLTLMGAMEVFAALSPSLCLCVEMSARVLGRAVAEWGGAAVKDQWLADLTGGRCVGAMALSEGAVNVDNEPLSTKATVEGDQVVINGTKQYVINAPTADVIGVAGMMDGKPAIFLVPKDASGLHVEQAVSTVGFDGASMVHLRLEDCAVAADQVIVPPEKAAMTDTLRFWENQVIVGLSIGLMKSSFENARDYAKQHRTGGKPIIAFQEIGFKLAEMLTLYQTAQLFAYRAAWTADNEPKAAADLTLCAKVFCTESAEQVATEAMRILGGAGYLAGNPVERAWRSAKYGQVFGTSTEIARVKIGDAAMGSKSAGV